MQAIRIRCRHQTRRDSVAEDITFAKLQENLSNLFGIDIAQEKLRYFDNDGEWIDFSSDKELREAIRLNNGKVFDIIAFKGPRHVVFPGGQFRGRFRGNFPETQFSAENSAPNAPAFGRPQGHGPCGPHGPEPREHGPHGHGPHGPRGHGPKGLGPREDGPHPFAHGPRGPHGPGPREHGPHGHGPHPFAHGPRGPHGPHGPHHRGPAGTAEPFRHPAKCDSCEAQVVGVRHRCNDCPDYDLCEKCIGKASEVHPNHTFTAMERTFARWHHRRPQHRGRAAEQPEVPETVTETQAEPVVEETKEEQSTQEPVQKNEQQPEPLPVAPAAEKVEIPNASQA